MKECTSQRVSIGALTIHVISVPEEGEGTNLIVLETRNRLLMIDVPLLEPHARELDEYVRALEKPIDRILVTHAHPDHWFTRSLWKDVPCQALKETIDEIKVLLPLQIGYHKQIHGEAMIADIQPPVEAIAPGTLIVDGLELKLDNYAETEDVALMVIEIPALKVLLAQDLVCIDTHLYLGTFDSNKQPTIDRWIAALRALDKRDFDTIIPGHGPLGTARPFAHVIDYLEQSKDVIASSKTSAEFKEAMRARFPRHRVNLVLEMSAYMLYDWGK
ncbi:MAG: MBL fold metallo-hydrolase [Deltaproteobacteria bacterium]|nr:MBL fold metallo-hydrolase [Deltaproteobacteria bacterium]